MIVDSISDSIKIDRNKLAETFIQIAEKHVKKEINPLIKNINDNRKEESLNENKIMGSQNSENMERKNKEKKIKPISKEVLQKEKRFIRKKTTLDDFNNNY